MKPLLGTFVEITVNGAGRNKSHQAMAAAFSEMERIQNLMSFHDDESEVSKLNRSAFDGNVCVSKETYFVVKMAKKLYEKTGGFFDIAVAPELMSWGVLPRLLSSTPRTSFYGRSSDILLLPGRRIRFLRNLKIDLGGIAKGFAVDRAVEILRLNGIREGMVNAGGDMRVFGREEYPVAVRHPKHRNMLVSITSLKNKALATSANSYDRLRRRGRWICAHVHGKTRKPCLRSFSVSVIADTCLAADALTKAVLASKNQASRFMREWNAQSFIIEAGFKTMTRKAKAA